MIDKSTETPQRVLIQERNIDMRKKHPSVAFYMHAEWGLNPGPFSV